MVQCHPMRIVLVVLICTTWEICFTFSKQNVIDYVSTKCEAYLPCGTNQNNQDNTHGMALYHSLIYPNAVYQPSRFKTASNMIQ